MEAIVKRMITNHPLVKSQIISFLTKYTPESLCSVTIPAAGKYFFQELTFYPIEKDGVFSWDRFTFEGNTYNAKEFVTQMVTKPQ